jgi:hypothetical protein
VRVNHRSLPSPLVILANRALEIIAAGKSLHIARAAVGRCERDRNDPCERNDQRGRTPQLRWLESRMFALRSRDFRRRSQSVIGDTCSVRL